MMQGKQEAGEGKVPQVIGGELQLKTVACLDERRCHDTCIVDEHIQPVIVAGEFIGKVTCRSQFR